MAVGVGVSVGKGVAVAVGVGGIVGLSVTVGLRTGAGGWGVGAAQAAKITSRLLNRRGFQSDMLIYLDKGVDA